MLSVDDQQSWFAVISKPQHEKSVASALAFKGYESYLPLYLSRHRHARGFRDVALPLFRSYVFCRLDPGRRLPVLETPGVLGFVSVGRTPAPIDDSEIESLRRVTASGLPLKPWPFLQAGDRVRVEEGPLSGAEGILVDADPVRLVVRLTILQRAVSVNVDRRWLRPLGSATVCDSRVLTNLSAGLAGTVREMGIRISTHRGAR